MAVYTEVPEEELEAFLLQYDLGEVLAFKGIAEGVENSNFYLKTTVGEYILTLYEKRVKPEDLPFFLDLMDHVVVRGIRCPLPVHGKDGEALREVANRPAAVFSFLEGLSPRRIQPSHCLELGRVLARLHLAAQDFPRQRPNTLSLAGWRSLLTACAPRADEMQKGLADILETELAFLEQSWPGDLPQGVCHADLFPDNVFFLGGKLSGLIDFYFACTDLWAYDLAICLNSWCFERDRSFNITKARLLLAGYREERAFAQAEVAALPLLARGAALRFLLTRLYDWLHHPEGALVKPKDPLEYLAYLKFHQSVTSTGAYGLD